ncbi:hypothetical protein SLS56_006196 [Neofusicoccum ribis]|uniref:Uncharacterized protein n=1 Tax=Neofusicoccum ribis TaxID=45134 RepID=A0ABR3SRH7_9PEZI
MKPQYRLLCPDWDDLLEHQKFLTAEQARAYKQSRKLLPPKKPDPTISKVARNKAAHVEELYEAIANVDEMQDKPGATYDTFTRKKSCYEPAFIFAVSWRLLLKAIVYSRDGFREPISYELQKHMISFPTISTCEERLEAACDVFRCEKSVCVDVLDAYLSDNIYNDFLINPCAYSHYQADKGDPPGKRRRRRTTRPTEIPISIYPGVNLLDHLQYHTDGSAADLYCKEMVDQMRDPINLNDTTVAEVEAGEREWIKLIYAAIVDDQSLNEEKDKLAYMVSTDPVLGDLNECDVQVIAYQILDVAIDGAVSGIVRVGGGKTSTNRKTNHTTSVTLKELLEAICARLRLDKAASVDAFTFDGPKIIEIVHDAAERLQNPNNTKSGSYQKSKKQKPGSNAGRSNKSGSKSKQADGRSVGDQPSQSGRTHRRAEPSATQVNTTTNTPDERQMPANSNSNSTVINKTGDSQTPANQASSIGVKAPLGSREVDRGYPARTANTPRRQPNLTPISAAHPSRIGYYTSLSRLPDPHQLPVGAWTTSGNKIAASNVERRRKGTEGQIQEEGIAEHPPKKKRKLFGQSLFQLQETRGMRV